MEALRHFPIAPGRKLGAWVCLLATVMLWAPMWAAAWQANSMACCNGTMCLAHGHSKPDHPSPRRATPSETPMDCEHHSGSGLTSCSMSCCQESTHALTAAMIFVLP